MGRGFAVQVNECVEIFNVDWKESLGFYMGVMADKRVFRFIFYAKKGLGKFFKS